MYYLVRVKCASDNGRKVTWKKEAYLVSAVSVTDAEAIVNKDFENTFNLVSVHNYYVLFRTYQIFYCLLFLY